MMGRSTSEASRCDGRNRFRLGRSFKAEAVAWSRLQQNAQVAEVVRLGRWELGSPPGRRRPEQLIGSKTDQIRAAAPRVRAGRSERDFWRKCVAFFSVNKTTVMALLLVHRHSKAARQPVECGGDVPGAGGPGRFYDSKARTRRHGSCPTTRLAARSRRSSPPGRRTGFAAASVVAPPGIPGRASAGRSVMRQRGWVGQVGRSKVRTTSPTRRRPRSAADLVERDFYDRARSDLGRRYHWASPRRPDGWL